MTGKSCLLLGSQTLSSVSDSPVQTMLTEAKGLGAGFCCWELINQGSFCVLPVLEGPSPAEVHWVKK